MKTITEMILLLILLSITKMNGQYYNANDYFQTTRYTEILDSNNYTASTTFDFYNSEPKIFNVHFYGLETTDGNNPSSLDENYSLEVIAKLNIAFNPYNIFFKYRGYDFYSEVYNGSELINQTHVNIMNRMYEVVQNEDTDNNINIVLHHLQCNNDKGSANIYKKIISLRYCTSSPIRVVYQMGHLLGLFKTQQGTGSGSHHDFSNPSPCNTIPSYSDRLFFPNHNGNVSGTPENVTRDMNNTNYNADTAGDMVTDTPAAFSGSEHNFCHLYGGLSSYDYIDHSNIKDDSSEQLMYENLDMLNFMCLRYSFLPAFERNHFTNGQGVRMRETIAIPSLNFNDVSTTVTSLYEPYKVETIETISSNIHSLTDNGDGTAEVCRLKSFTLNHYFQPGFDYDFYNQSDIVFNHHVDKNDLYGILDTGVLRYVKINQVNPNFIDITDDYVISMSDMNSGTILYEPIVCMRPVDVCVTEPYSRGRVMSTTNLANPNVTIKVLNSQEASDANLEQDLESGKFHIIEKTTTSGATIQKTIYKREN